ncbi:hypothetical protein Noda2021_08010 [Candidatus Dependentiae bacterium Noda2021]|nr:hypothetical protein Noda2021_08010 [Candidatus Dependentiae bacterium Noda2021]
MKKILGNSIALVLFVFVHSSAQEIAIKSSSMDGKELEYAVVGQPFLVHVMLSPASSTHTQPELSYDQSLHVRQAGFQMQSINGASQITYNYRVYAEKEGTYSVGPARLQTNQQSLVSNTLRINVVAEAPVTTSKHKREAPKAFLRLSTNKKQVFVGEKVRCFLRFYNVPNKVQLRHIGEPEPTQCDYFTIQKKQGPQSGQESIDGVDYDFKEWSWELYPKDAGSCLIPAYYADYNLPSRRDDFFSLFSSVLNGVSEQKRVYSNGVSLTVKPLPASKKDTQAVGTFESYTASIDSRALKQGEGAVLTMSLVGDADFDRIDQPALLDMPAQLKWYESKVTTAVTSTGMQQKNFEYIVQGTQAGDWVIPSQEFTYFDTKSKRYKTVQTTAINVHVIPMNGYSRRNQETVAEDETQTASVQSDQEIEPLPLAQGPWHASQEKFMPWRLLVITCIMLAGLSALAVLTIMIKSGGMPLQAQKKYAYAKAQKQIAKAQKKYDYSLLYNALQQFIALKSNNSSYLSESELMALLSKLGVSENIQSKWEQYWQQLAEARFGFKVENLSSPELFVQAREWLQFWQELL